MLEAERTRGPIYLSLRHLERGYGASAVSHDRGHVPQGGIRPGSRSDSRRAGRSLRHGRSRNRSGRPNLVCLDCLQPARSPVRGCMAPIDWPATRCSKGLCSAHVPAVPWQRRRRIPICRRPFIATPRHPSAQCATREMDESEIRTLMWQCVALFRDGARLREAVERAARTGGRARRSVGEPARSITKAGAAPASSPWPRSSRRPRCGAKRAAADTSEPIFRPTTI